MADQSAYYLNRRAFFRATVASSSALGLTPPDAAAAVTVPFRKGYARGRFGLIHYRIAQPAAATGRPPLFCFHASPRSGRSYETLLRHIGSDRFAIAPDTPGFGDSDPPSEPPAIDDYAGAMGDLIDALGFEKIDVLGYHTGSQIAIEVARQRPDQVQRVVLVSTPIYNPEEQAQKKIQYQRESLTEDGSHLAKKWRTFLKWAMPGQTREQVAYQLPDTLRRPRISWWGHNAAFSYPCAERLAALTQPVLVINPKDDLYEKTQRAAQHLRNGRIHEALSWSHGFLDVHPVQAAALIRSHLDAEVAP